MENQLVNEHINEYFSKLRKRKPDCLITFDTLLSLDNIQYIRNLNPTVEELKLLIIKGGSYSQHDGFQIKGVCQVCYSQVNRFISKTNLISILSSKRAIDSPLCKYCEKQRIKEMHLRESQRKISESVHPNDFINVWLNKDMAYKEGSKLTIYQKMGELEHDYIRLTDKEQVVNYILGLEYTEFLETLYWKNIASYIRYKNKYKCTICSKQAYDVHHRNYINHGKEIENTKDLILLCRDCHTHFHKKLTNIK